MATAMNTALTAATAAVQTAITAAGVLQGATPAVLAPVALAISNALATFDAQAATLEKAIDGTTVGGVVSGLPLPQVIATFNAQYTDVQQFSYLRQGRAYLARAGVNVANSPG